MYFIIVVFVPLFYFGGPARFLSLKLITLSWSATDHFGSKRILCSNRRIQLTGSVVRGAPRSSPPCARSVQGRIALQLRHRHRRARVRKEPLRGVVLVGVTASKEDAEEEEGPAGLLRAELHGCTWAETRRSVGVPRGDEPARARSLL